MDLLKADIHFGRLQCRTVHDSTFALLPQSRAASFLTDFIVLLSGSFHIVFSQALSTYNSLTNGWKLGQKHLEHWWWESLL